MIHKNWENLTPNKLHGANEGTCEKFKNHNEFRTQTHEDLIDSSRFGKKIKRFTNFENHKSKCLMILRGWILEENHLFIRILSVLVENNINLLITHSKLPQKSPKTDQTLSLKPTS